MAQKANERVQNLAGHLKDDGVSPGNGQDSPVFSPLVLGGSPGFKLQHRIVMASMARHRVGLDGVPKADLVSKYYVQRSTPGGLVLTEATCIDPEGVAAPRCPGIWSDPQVESWRSVVRAVKTAQPDGVFFMQTWHCGRSSHSAFQPNNQLPVSSSPIAQADDVILGRGKKVPHEVPRELTTEEARERTTWYGRGARRAVREAGFDGVELHGANGYLLNQFLESGTNKRRDIYGGSAENRCRFLVESVKETIKALDGESGRVAIRLSPWGSQGEISDEDPIATYSTLLRMLAPLNLAYVHFVEPPNMRYKPLDYRTPRLDPLTNLAHSLGITVLTCGGYLPDMATQLLSKHTGHVDLVGFARLFISNPDLVERIRRGLPVVTNTVFDPYNPPQTTGLILQQYDANLFYATIERGYVDYPALREDPQHSKWGRWTGYKGLMWGETAKDGK
ncbi:12-oxo-phytodienoic acid-like protein [Hyaloraphidium curvatum]|nr:12-oxo-phytodienoic acid-like protein [Hyaloraphidium curvatum]